MHTHKISIFLLLFSCSMWCMDDQQKRSMISLFPPEIWYGNIMEQQSNLQAVGRFGQTCCAHNEWYRNFMLCKMSADMDRVKSICSAVSKKLDKCTQGLVFYAKKYKKNPENERLRAMFEYLWRHHANIRVEAVGKVIDKTIPILSDCIDVYAGEYGAQEMGDLLRIHTPLAEKMKDAVAKENSYKLKKFLIEDDSFAVKTMLLTDNLLFYPNWSGYKFNRDSVDKYRFNDKKKYTILDCACILENIVVVDWLVKASPDDYFHDAIQAIIHYQKICLFDAFIRKNYEKSLEYRFSIWYTALQGIALLKSRTSFSIELRHELYEKIVTLLFSEHINAQDENGKTLLHWAVHKYDELAINFLRERGASADIRDTSGASPFDYAY